MLVTQLPEGLKLANDSKMVFVESDLYGIVERLQQIDPNLYVVFHEKNEKPFTVMERCADGVMRFVARYEELDARVIEHMQYLLKVPFEERLKKVEKEIDEANALYEKPDEEILDWLATEMRRDMLKYGIV